MTRPLKALVLALFILSGVMAGVPYTYSAGKKSMAKDPGEFFGVIRKDDVVETSRLRELLGSLNTVCEKVPKKCTIADELYHEIFGNLNNQNLPILLVYLDEDMEVQANRLIWRRSATPFVYGVQNVWVMIFSDTEVHLQVQLTNLYSDQTGIAEGLGNIFISSGRRTQEDGSAREWDRQIDLQPWNSEPSVEDTLWFGAERFYVDVDTGYKISILPANDKTREASDFERIEARFTNTKRRSVDFGIGFGVTGDISDEDLENAGDVDGIRTDNGILSAYWMVHTYIRRPTLLDPITRRAGSRYRISYAVTFGLNLDVFNLDQFIVGLNVGHLFGRHGIVVGANILDLFESKQDTTIKPFFGVAFTF